MLRRILRWSYCELLSLYMYMYMALAQFNGDLQKEGSMALRYFKVQKCRDGCQVSLIAIEPVLENKYLDHVLEDITCLLCHMTHLNKHEY